MSSLFKATLNFLLISFLFVLFGCAGNPPANNNNPNATKPEPIQRQSGGGLPWGGGGTKLGFVRSDVIIQKYPNYQDAERILREENKKWQEEVNRLEREIVRLEAEREELVLILSDERKKQLDDDLEKRHKDLQKFKQDTWYAENSTYLKRRRELMDPIDARINDAIWKIADQQGLDMVFDSVAGNIVFTKPGLDITDLVLEELQR